MRVMISSSEPFSSLSTEDDHFVIEGNPMIPINPEWQEIERKLKLSICREDTPHIWAYLKNIPDATFREVAHYVVSWDRATKNGQGHKFSLRRFGGFLHPGLEFRNLGGGRCEVWANAQNLRTRLLCSILGYWLGAKLASIIGGENYGPTIAVFEVD